MSAYDENGFTPVFDGSAGGEDGLGLAEAPVGSVPLAADAPRMIIVEDAPLIALDLAETMRELGFDVRATAFTHEQAISEIERTGPDFAVVDLHLGAGENGVREGESLLSILDERGCRCLVFSGDEAACARVARRYPNFAVLSKPAQPDRLVAEIQKLRGGNAGPA